VAAEVFELLGYFAGTWLYVFSQKYRDSVHKEWHDAVWWEKALLLLQFIISFICGVVLPALVIWWVIDGQLF